MDIIYNETICKSGVNIDLKLYKSYDEDLNVKSYASEISLDSKSIYLSTFDRIELAEKDYNSIKKLLSNIQIDKNIMTL